MVYEWFWFINTIVWQCVVELWWTPVIRVLVEKGFEHHVMKYRVILYASLIFLFATLGIYIPSILGDVTYDYSTEDQSILDEVFDTIDVCMANPMWRFFVRHSKIIHVTRNDSSIEEREFSLDEQSYPSIFPTGDIYAVKHATVRNYTFFAIPYGFTTLRNSRVVNCRARIEVENLRP